jgi:hypothetical protein
LAEPGTRTEMTSVFSSFRFNKPIVRLLHSRTPLFTNRKRALPPPLRTTSGSRETASP